MKTTIHMLFLNQGYIIKKAWQFSKSFFVYRFITAIFSGIMPTINVYMYKILVDDITKSLLNSALVIILSIAIVNLTNSLVNAIINKKIGIKEDLFRNSLVFDLQSKTANMDYGLLFTPDMSKKKEMAMTSINYIGTGYLNNTFSLFSAAVSILSLGYILSTVSFWVFLIFVVISTVKIITIVRDKKNQFTTTSDMSPINRKVGYYMTMLTDQSYANDVRMYSISDWAISKYKKTIQEIHSLMMNLLNRNFTTIMLRSVLEIVESSMFYVFLAVQVIFFGMTFAIFTMVLSALQTFSSKIATITRNLIDLGESSVYMEKYKDFMQTENIIAKDNTGLPVKSINKQKNIYDFNNVSFQYPGTDQLTLKNVNISIESNKFYVIVGENGVGKTTLSKLICRLYDVESGEILYNGTDIKDIKYKEYRNLIGMVFQDYKYYDLSIAENVAMNEYKDTEEIRNKIYNSLVTAGLKDKIDSLPNGIDTQLGRTFDENGVLLSGGELQKLALAKVLFQDAPIIILDEPSSALDALAEDELIRTFNQALAGKTVFYISHRLSVAKYAHKVIFLANHTIEAFAPHSELIKTCEKYAGMYNAQAKHYLEAA